MEEFTLCVAIWHRDTSRLTVLVYASAPDHCPDRILVCDGSVERFQNENTAAFAASKSSTSLIKSNGFARIRKQATRR